MPDALQTLLDKDRIVDTVNRLFTATDARDWAAVRDCFTEKVHFDMTSLAGGTPSVLAAADIAAAWEQGLAPLDAIHHQAGNYRVEIEGEQATAFCYGIAIHYKRTASGRNTRTFVGSYDFQLARFQDAWKISAFKFTLKFLDGNLELEKDA